MQQVELGGGEVNLFVTEEHFVGVHVQGEGVNAQYGVVLLLDAAATAQNGADAGDYLVEGEGLGDVVVAAGTQTGHLVLGGVLCGQEEHGGGGAVFAQAAGHLEAVHAGHHDVQDNEVGFFGVRLFEGFAAVAGGNYFKTGETQGGGEQFKNVELVIDD